MSPILGIIASSQTASTLTSFESIATATGTGSSGTITFSSIPSNYSHLQLRMIVRCDTNNTYPGTLLLKFNNVGTATYRPHFLSGNGSSASAGSESAATTSIYLYNAEAVNDMTATTYAASIIDIIDYANTSKNKTARVFSGIDGNAASTTYRVTLGSGAWFNTNAINRIDISSQIGNFTTASTFALYGIKG